MKDQRHLGIQADTELVNKFYYIAKYYGRSGSGQMVYLMRMFVEDFERDHGIISEEDLKNIGIKL